MAAFFLTEIPTEEWMTSLLMFTYIPINFVRGEGQVHMHVHMRIYTNTPRILYMEILVDSKGHRRVFTVQNFAALLHTRGVGTYRGSTTGFLPK